MPRLIWVFAGRTSHLLVLSWCGSIMFIMWICPCISSYSLCHYLWSAIYDCGTSCVTSHYHTPDKCFCLSDYIKQPTIAFNVRDAKDFSPQRHDIIRFSTVLLNLGGAYDETTGIFTSPVNGTFIFSIQIATHVIRWGIFQLVVDNSSKIILSITHYNADANYSSTSGTVAHVLTEGQMVWLQFQYDSGSTQRLGEHADYASNQFSGVLVHKNVNWENYETAEIEKDLFHEVDIVWNTTFNLIREITYTLLWYTKIITITGYTCTVLFLI